MAQSDARRIARTAAAAHAVVASPPRGRVVAAVGSGQLLAWASSYYPPAILAQPMALELALPPSAVYAAFSAALLLAAFLGPVIGGLMDRHGGRKLLLASNAVFAAGLGTLALAQGPLGLVLGFLLIGAAMPMGLYDAAFSTLVSLYGASARRSIVGVTLIAGFSSSLSWPLTALIEAEHGWRAACALWALLHLTLGPAIHYFLLPRTPPLALHTVAVAATTASAPPVSTLWILAAVFTASGFVFAALAAHLPRVLQAAGCTPTVAITAAALVGIAQVGGRLAEAGFLHRLHPLVSARISMALHPFGVLVLMLAGAPAAMLFCVLHGAGIGLMTIVKGTLPLALFGAQGFGRRAGWLEAPSRIAQALAPLVFGIGLDALGERVLWISGAIALTGFIGVLCLGRSESVPR